MLAVLHFNQIRDAEESGERVVLREKRVFSKAKGDFVVKRMKSEVHHSWKNVIADAVIEQKLTHLINLEENDDLEDLENDLDVDIDDNLADLFTNLEFIESEDEADEE